MVLCSAAAGPGGPPRSFLSPALGRRLCPKVTAAATPASSEGPRAPENKARTEKDFTKYLIQPPSLCKCRNRQLAQGPKLPGGGEDSGARGSGQGMGFGCSAEPCWTAAMDWTHAPSLEPPWCKETLRVWGQPSTCALAAVRAREASPATWGWAPSLSESPGPEYKNDPR